LYRTESPSPESHL